MKPISIIFPCLLGASVSFAQKPVSKTADTANSFKFNNRLITPKRNFEFNTMVKLCADSMDIATCSDFVFSPFGNLTAKSDFKKTLLSNFGIAERKTSRDGKLITDQFKFKSKASWLTIEFDNDREASNHSYVINGEIRDVEIPLADKVRIGMSVDEFCRTFFEYPADPVFDKIKVILFESCVDDIIHVYTFQNKKLTSVKFVKI